MMVAGARTSQALGALAVLVLLVTVGGGAAAAVDSPRLDQVTCEGLRIRQSGLPAQMDFVIEVSDPESGEELARQEARSNRSGVLDASITASFDGARQLAVEVEVYEGDEEVEFAEAIHEFGRPCPAARAGSSTHRRTPVIVTAVAAVVLVTAGGTFRRLRRGRG